MEKANKLFTGQREMAGLGIYHYGARFYSPKLGRFLSADTIVPGAANPQAYNRYSYVLNNPLRYTDPTGHYCVGDDEDCADEGGNGPALTGTGGNNGNGGGGGGGGGNPHDDDDFDPNPNHIVDIPGQCDYPHCLDEREYEPLPSVITITWKSWEEIDKFDLGVDAFGLLGDFLLTVGGPPGAIVWFGSEVLELMTISKNFDQMELGRPTAGVQVVVDTLGAGVDAARLAPWGGAVANLVSIGLNITEIKVDDLNPR